MLQKKYNCGIILQKAGSFIMIIVAGLGNPDLKYKNNVHNLGFMAIDLLAEKLGVTFDKKGYKGVYTIFNYQGERVMLIKPQTYMNLSGECLISALNFYKVPTQNLLVIYDDLDVDKGCIRIRQKGSGGTHNGMKNIVQHLSSQDFPRIRIGCKPQGFMGDTISYVLSDINKSEYQSALDKASDSALAFIKGERLDIIMNKFNG